MKKINKIILPTISFIVIILLWQFVSSFELVNSHLIPPPSKIFTAFVEWVKSGEFMEDFFTSTGRGVLGFVIGSLIGLLLGFFTGRNNYANLFLSPVLNLIKAFPPVALLPVFITFLGIGNFSKIFAISFSAIFPVWINTHIGAGAIPIEYIRSAKLLTKSKSKYFFKIIFPASLNSILGGLRMSIAISFIMIFVTELAGASSGLGYQISNSNLSFRMDKMFAALFVLGLSAAFVDMMFSKIVKFSFPWLAINYKTE